MARPSRPKPRPRPPAAAALHCTCAISFTSSAARSPASVKGETGNGGNIIIDPQLVILESQPHQGRRDRRPWRQHFDHRRRVHPVIRQRRRGHRACPPALSVEPRLSMSTARWSSCRANCAVVPTCCAKSARRAATGRSLPSPRPAGAGCPRTRKPPSSGALYRRPRAQLQPQSLEEAPEASGALQTSVRLTMRCG